MKKTICTLLCLTLLVSMFSVSAMAVGEPAIVVSSVETTLGAGKTVEITIRLQNNPGIAIFDLKAQYDESILEWTELETNTDIGGIWITGVGETLAWVSFGENFTNDTTLCTLTFAIKDTVTSSCETEITVTYDQETGIVNADRVGLQIPVQAGKVSVNAKHIDTEDTPYNEERDDSGNQTESGFGVTSSINEDSDNTGHTPVIDEAVSPTCTATGLTEGSHCADCGKVLVVQAVVPALGHTTELVGKTAATYTDNGYSGDLMCTACYTIIAYGHRIPKLEHNEAIDATATDIPNQISLPEGIYSPIYRAFLLAQMIILPCSLPILIGTVFLARQIQNCF